MGKIIHLVVTCFVFVVVATSILNTVRANTLSDGKVTISDSRVNQSGVQYSIELSNQSTDLVRCIVVSFSSERGISAPINNLNIEGASFNTGSTFVPSPNLWTLSGSNLSGAITLTNATGETPSGGSNQIIILDNITNGSDVGVGYWVEVNSYSDTSCTLEVDSHGSGAFIFTDGITISATVEAELGLTLDSGNCSFGALSTSLTKTCTVGIDVSSNSNPNGYSLSYHSATPLTHTENNNTVPFVGANAVPSQAGIDQFGFNLVANTNPEVGVNPSGGGIGAPLPNYNTPNQFAFTSSGAGIAATAAAAPVSSFIASYIANISEAAFSGNYVATKTLLLIANP